MRCLLAVVGKPRDAGLAAAIEAYETRAARYWPLEVKEVREERSGSLSPAEVRAREGARLRAATTGARVIACDEGGTDTPDGHAGKHVRRQPIRAGLALPGAERHGHQQKSCRKNHLHTLHGRLSSRENTR